MITENELRAEYERLMRRDQEIDEKALSIHEVSELLELSYSHASKVARDKVGMGEWEKVFKRNPDGRIIPAYRPRRKDGC